MTGVSDSSTAQDDDPFAPTKSSTVNAQADDPFSQPNPAAQDNPFGSSQPGAASPKLNVLPKIDPNLDQATRLIIESVRKSNPVTPLQLARAIQTMLDIEQYADARYYLAVLMGTGADDKTIFEMHEVLGPNLFLKIFYQDELQPEGRQFGRVIVHPARFHSFFNARTGPIPAFLSALVRIAKTPPSMHR